MYKTLLVVALVLFTVGCTQSDPIVVTPTELPPVEATTWQTHTNAQGGYQVEYPSDWTVSNTIQSESIELISPERSANVDDFKRRVETEGLAGDGPIESDIGIWVYNDLQQLMGVGSESKATTLREFLETTATFSNVTSVDFAGTTALRAKPLELPPGEDTFLERNGKIYQIHLTFLPDAGESASDDQVQIRDSFAFTQ